MRSILIKGDPYRLVRIPPSHLLHELTDRVGAFARQECPAGPPAVNFIEEDKIDLPPGLVLARQHQPFCRRRASSTVGFDSNDLDIKEPQHAVPWPMTPAPAEAAQNRAALGIVTDQLALAPAKAQPPFLSNRRRCSRLTGGRTRCVIR